MDEAAVADRMIVLDGGRIAADGTPDDIFAKTDRLSELGILPPQCAAVMNELKKRGYPLRTGITPERCAEIIASACGVRPRSPDLI